MSNYDIWAACALSADGFAISTGLIEDGPQFSRLALHRAPGMPEWNYLHFESTLMWLTRLDGWRHGALLAALGIDGDVSFVGQQFASEQIPEAGAGDDEEGRGSMSQIRQLGDLLIACGYGSQVYVRDTRDAWTRIADSDDEALGDNAFEAVARNANGEWAACGNTAAAFREPTAAEQAELDRIAETGTMPQYLAAKERFETRLAGEIGCLYVRNKRRWTGVDLPGNTYLEDVIVLEDGRFLAAGGGGLIVAGRDPYGFEDFSQPSFAENYHSICLVGGRPHLLGDTVIHVLGKDLQLEEEIGLPDELQSPLLIDVADSVLWYFDHKGVAKRRQNAWVITDLPDDVWEEVRHDQ
ncbi:hypothetical protein X740_32060 [Mesorhizobium sp. LNHC221B00]|uniref:hypothetical protein n=1 Tax=Mesorhizobium sp. LNHC221B00 TaxID=1287233 RepID=UPI0003CE12DD|nr:hypothetical protein [Mesorhizobium sp. LNHC221B00]ESY74142.1 hypothetical protein X740_32060 [Mesorhizobium sp. LNHC221B00]